MKNCIYVDLKKGHVDLHCLFSDYTMRFYKNLNFLPKKGIKDMISEEYLESFNLTHQVTVDARILILFSSSLWVREPNTKKQDVKAGEQAGTRNADVRGREKECCHSAKNGVT